MRIEYVVNLGKDGPRITHRVIYGASDDGGMPGATGPDGGGSGIPVVPDSGGRLAVIEPEDNGGVPGATGPDDGGVPGATGPDDGGVPGATGPDDAGNRAMAGGYGCETVIVLGPTIITGVGGGGRRGSASTGSLRKLPATFEIDRVPTSRSLDTMKESVAVQATNGPLVAPEMRGQEQWNWCWAAVGSAVRKFMDSAVAMGQCDVADMVMADENKGKTPLLTSCQDPAPSNVPKSLNTTLKLLDHLQDGALGGVASFRLIQEETGAGRPIAARIAWDTYGRGIEEGAHFVLIAGSETVNGVDMVKVLDPAAGLTDPKQAAKPRAVPTVLPRSVPYQEFRDAYSGTGKWVASYFVKEMSQ